jgi:hypothetical protein
MMPAPKNSGYLKVSVFFDIIDGYVYLIKNFGDGDR